MEIYFLIAAQKYEIVFILAHNFILNIKKYGKK